MKFILLLEQIDNYAKTNKITKGGGIEGTLKNKKRLRKK